MQKRTDIGFQALEKIYNAWQIDDDRITWQEDGFDWWPGHFRQSLRVSEATNDQLGMPTYKITATTDFVKNTQASPAVVLRMIDALGKLAPCYSIRIAPSELDGKITLISTAYLHKENAAWLPRFFSQIALLQPIDAQGLAAHVAPELEGDADASSPEADGELRDLDEILGVAAEIYAPIGQEANRWVGTGEFEQLAEAWGNTPTCFGSGDATGLTLETPFGTDTALIRLITDQPHPRLGNGLLATLQLPWFANINEVLDGVDRFNFSESISTTFFPLLGHWCTHPTRDDAIGAAFSMFIPNAIYSPGMASNAAAWLIGRSKWVKTTFWPDLQDSPLDQIIEERIKTLGINEPVEKPI